jgi:hypothetical protein
MEATVNWEELGIEANKDRRREVRIALAVPIEETGFDEAGGFFCDLTKTVDISESGCSFPLKRHLERGGIIAIKVAIKDGKKIGAASFSLPGCARDAQKQSLDYRRGQIAARKHLVRRVSEGRSRRRPKAIAAD